MFSRKPRFLISSSRYAVNRSVFSQGRARVQGVFKAPLLTSSSFRPWQQCPLRISNQLLRHMSVVKSPYPPLDIPKMPLGQYIMKDFDKWSDKTAVVDSITGKTYTFKEVKQFSRSVGSALLKVGVKKGDVVCVHSRNCAEFVFAFLGVVGIGATLTPANPAYTSREIFFQLEASKAKHLITSSDVLEPAREASKAFGKLKNMFVIGGDHVPGCRPFSDLLKDNGDSFPDDLVCDPSDTVLLPYSSGTTGLPKGVMLSHENMVSNLCGMTSDHKIMKMSQVDTVLGFLPFYHSFGLMVVLSISLHCGAKLVTIPKFEVDAYLRLIEDQKATRLMIVPPVGVLLAKYPLVDEIDFSSVIDIFSGAAPLGAETELAIKERIGIRIRQGYGMTEVSPGAMAFPLSSNLDCGYKQGSVGLLVPNAEAQIRDVETDVPLDVGKEGEICLRGPMVMKGYLNNKEATENCMEADGWMRTGDIGYYDEDGYFYIVDRLKELIKYKSVQVPPAELETIILSMPGVVDVAVIGKPDDATGELPLAFVVKKKGVDTTEEEIMKFVEERVTSSKRLRGGVIMVEEIPKSPSGKILRRVLRERIMKS